MNVILGFIGVVLLIGCIAYIVSVQRSEKYQANTQANLHYQICVTDCVQGWNKAIAHPVKWCTNLCRRVNYDI